jgi:hypothetical protein
MKSKIGWGTVFLFLIFFGNWSSGALRRENIQDPLNQEELENYLRTAKVVSVTKDSEKGRTAPWKIELDDGKIQMPGFFKYVNRPRPGVMPTSYKYEIAAYKLNRLLDLNYVPPTITREVAGVKGSLQIFLTNCVSRTVLEKKKIEPPDPVKYQNALDDLKIFENLVYDECQDRDDTLIHKETWKVYRVDFSEAFSPTSELLPDCDITRCSKKLFQNLSQLKNDVIKNVLKYYLNPDEINELLKRKKNIVEKIKELIEEKGEGPVLFS